MKRHFLFAMCSIFITIHDSHAFEVKEINVASNLRILRWNTSQGPVRITLNSQGSDDLPLPDVETSVRNALDQWQSVSGQALTFQYMGTSPSAISNSSDMINSIVWVEKDWKYSSTVLGITRYSYFLEDPPVLVDADILMNGETQHWSTSVEGQKGVHPQQVLMHEIGHLIGLTHSSIMNSTLFPFLPDEVRLKLSKDDKAAIKFLYGDPATDFRSITPIQGAVFPESMLDDGLPAPVFRWGTGGSTNFMLEFSDSKSFERKETVAVGQNNFYLLTSSVARKLLKLSSVKNVFWRVSNGGGTTHTRVLRFRNPDNDELGHLGAIVAADMELSETWKRTILWLTSGLVLSILLILLLRIRAQAR